MTSCTVSYLLGQGGKNKYALDIGGNFLCVVGSGACRCVRNRRLDLAVLRNLDHLSDRATRKWPRTRNIHSPAEDVSRSSPESKAAGDKAPAVLLFSPCPTQFSAKLSQ